MLCSLTLTCQKADKQFGKVTHLRSSHLGIQVRRMKNNGLLTRGPLSPALLSAQTPGPQLYAWI